MLLFASVLHGQQVRVLLDEPIDTDISHASNEPHLIVDPTDDQHLLVATIVTKKWDEGLYPDSYIALVQSWDGGKKWEATHFDKGHSFAADPWLAMNQQGTVLLSMLTRLEGERGVSMIYYRSSDRGRSWKDTFVHLGVAHDRQSIAVDPKTQDFVLVSAKPNLNMDHRRVGGLSIARISARGFLRSVHWHPVSTLDKNNHTPIITSDGRLLIPFVDYMVNNQQLHTRRNWLLPSDDLGQTFLAPRLINEGGRFPVMGSHVDSSGLTLFCFTGAGKGRNYLGITFQSSTDEGYTWTPLQRIDQYGGEKPYMRNPVVAVNQSGTIGAFWFDRRFDEGTGGHRLVASFSTDGGESFSEPIPIASTLSVPDPRTNGKVDERWPVGGDYFGLTTDSAGHFRVVWADHRDGLPALYQAIVLCSKD